MKKLSINFLAAAGLSLGLLGFTSMREGGIQGTISPVDAATQIIAVSGTDTLKAAVLNGGFTLPSVKKGTYTIWIKAKTPYKDMAVENVAVIDSAITDVGEIKLQ